MSDGWRYFRVVSAIDRVRTERLRVAIDALEKIATGEIAGERSNHRDTVRLMRDIAKDAIDRIASDANPTEDPLNTPHLIEAAEDALSGWRYIREHHGDLYGVGWDRVEKGLSEALAGVLK